MAYNDVIAKLKKAEVRLKTGLQDQNLARLISTRNQGSFNRNRLKKRACHYCSKPGHFKRECKKL
jgi:Zinc knuckle